MVKNRTQHSYPRANRLSSLFTKILAEEIEKIAYTDERFFLITLTGVVVDPDIRHATVFFDSLTDAQVELLDEYKPRLRSAIASKTQLKRVPQLNFMIDPAIDSANKIEVALHKIEFHEEVFVDKDKYKNL